MLSNHCAAEAAEPETIRGTTFDKWDQLPHRPDNHLFDCIVGAAVAASVLGLQWSATPSGEMEQPPRGKTMAEQQAEARKRKASAEAAANSSFARARRR